MKIQVLRRNITSSTQNALRASSNFSEAQNQAQFGQSLENAGQAVARSGDVFAQIQAKRNQYELNENLQARTAQFDELMNLMDRDESILDFDQAFEEKSKEIYQEGKNKLSLPGMQRDYDQAFEQAKQSYTRQVTSLSTRRTMSDGAARGSRLIENSIKDVGISYESFISKRDEVIAFLSDSPFYSPEEKQQLLESFNEQALNSAMYGGLRKMYETTEGSYTQRADTTRDWILSTENLLNQEMTSEQLDKYLGVVDVLEAEEKAREEEMRKQVDINRDDAIWDYVKKGDVSNAYNFFQMTRFHDNAYETRWYNFFKTKLDEPDLADDKRNTVEQDIWDIKEAVEQGDITLAQGAAVLESRVATYGEDEDIGGLYRDGHDDLTDIRLTENDAYKTGVDYLKNNELAQELKEEHPALYAMMEQGLKDIAKDPENDLNMQYQTYQTFIDKMMLEPVIKKMNGNIQAERFIGDGLNEIEQMTQQFSEGNFSTLLDVDGDGNINTDRYKEWITAWGYDEKSNGKYKDIDTFLKDYMDEFGKAALRDFPGTPKVEIDTVTNRPMINVDDMYYVLQLDGKDEAWYRWDKDSGQYTFEKEVGR